MVEHFTDPSAQKSIEVDVTLIDQYDTLVNALELTIVRAAKRHDGDAFHGCARCQAIGVKDVLGLC